MFGWIISRCILVSAITIKNMFFNDQLKKDKLYLLKSSFMASKENLDSLEILERRKLF